MSDQDFFFDEDEKPAAKSGAKKGSTPSKTTSSAPVATASVEAQSVSLMVAVLIGVIGVLLGVVVGLFVGKGMVTPAITATTGAGISSTPTTSAPQLTQEQLEGGALPEGHPQIGATSPTATTPAE